MDCFALSTGLGPRDAAKKLSQNVARRVIGARCFLGHRDTHRHRVVADPVRRNVRDCLHTDSRFRRFSPDLPHIIPGMDCIHFRSEFRLLVCISFPFAGPSPNIRVEPFLAFCCFFCGRILNTADNVQKGMCGGFSPWTRHQPGAIWKTIPRRAHPFLVLIAAPFSCRLQAKRAARAVSLRCASHATAMVEVIEVTSLTRPAPPSQPAAPRP